MRKAIVGQHNHHSVLYWDRVKVDLVKEDVYCIVAVCDTCVIKYATLDPKGFISQSSDQMILPVADRV